MNAPCDEIMDCYRAALALARRLRAQESALRAATRLAHFQHGHGQWGEGRRELQEIYDWFDEGHDTPDLQVAAAML
jgi:hypothetical protein